MKNKHFWPFIITLTLLVSAYARYNHMAAPIHRSEIINGVTCTYDCWEKFFGGAAQQLTEVCGERREVIRQELESFPEDVLKVEDSADYRYIYMGPFGIEYQSARVSKLKVPTVIPRGWAGPITEPIEAIKQATRELAAKKRLLLRQTSSLSER
jgi:hypothetical protein